MSERESSPPSSSVVREAAMAWHRDVRRALARGLRAVAEARKSPTGSSEHLLGAAAGIAAVVHRQVAAENANLAPVLAELDAWGALRVAKMQELHQREEAALVHPPESADPASLAPKLEASIREILRALRIEEKELLDADLLDDSTTVPRGPQSAG